MRAHIYCRISTGKGGSDCYQIDECIEYCEKNGLEIGYIYNHTQSSRNMKNGEFLESIINSDMNPGDVLIVHSICRFSRNMSGGLRVLEKLSDKGIKIYSVDDQVGYDDMYDRFRFRHIMNCSELETDKISHRVKQSVKHRKRKRSVVEPKVSKRKKRRFKNTKETENQFISAPLALYDELVDE